MMGYRIQMVFFKWHGQYYSLEEESFSHGLEVDMLKPREELNTNHPKKPLVRLFDQPFSKLSNVLFMFMCSMAIISTISCIVIAIVRPTLSVNAPFTQQLVVRIIAIVEYIAGGIAPLFSASHS